MNNPFRIVMECLSLLVMAGAALAQSAPTVADPTKKGVTPAEVQYQAGASPLADADMHQNLNPKAPAMTKAEFDKGRQIPRNKFDAIEWKQDFP